MNQEQLKEILLRIEEPEEDFTLIFSGKKSNKVDGLYYPETAEIIIHNKNMERDDELIYTGIHEYAHHLCGNTRRSHSRDFWVTFHRLLEKAENEGIYKNPLRDDSELKILAVRIRTEFLQEEGQRVLEFGKLLMQAYQICHDRRYSFEDFADRELGMQHSVARNLIRTYKEDVPTQFGYENMKGLLRIKDPEKRKDAVADLEKGKSPDTVYHEYSAQSVALEIDDEKMEKRLRQEEKRIERTLKRLNDRLDDVRMQISRLENQ